MEKTSEYYLDRRDEGVELRHTVDYGDSKSVRQLTGVPTPFAKRPRIWDGIGG